MLIQEFDASSSVFCCRIRLDDIRLDAGRDDQDKIVAKLVINDPVQVERLLKNTYPFGITLDFTVTAFADNLGEFVEKLEKSVVTIEGSELRAVGLKPTIISPVVEVKPDIVAVLHYDIGEEEAA